MAEEATDKLRELKTQQQTKKKQYDALQADVSKIVGSIQQQNALLSETTLCLEELSKLDDSATIYKLAGPILVKQDLDGSKANVNTRLNFIKKQVGTLEKQVTAKKSEIDTLTTELRELYTKVKAAEAEVEAASK